jgi:hypothetical protein
VKGGRIEGGTGGECDKDLVLSRYLAHSALVIFPRERSNQHVR